MIRISFWVKSCACWVEIINRICASGHIIPEPDTRLILYSVQCSHHNMVYSVQCCTRHGEHSSEHRQSVSKKLSWGGQLAGAAPPPAPPTRCQQWGYHNYHMWILLSSRTLGQWHQSGWITCHTIPAYVTIDQIMVKHAGNKYFFRSFSQIQNRKDSTNQIIYLQVQCFLDWKVPVHIWWLTIKPYWQLFAVLCDSSANIVVVVLVSLIFTAVLEF